MEQTMLQLSLASDMILKLITPVVSLCVVYENRHIVFQHILYDWYSKMSIISETNVSRYFTRLDTFQERFKYTIHISVIILFLINLRVIEKRRLGSLEESKRR